MCHSPQLQRCRHRRLRRSCIGRILPTAGATGATAAGAPFQDWRGSFSPILIAAIALITAASFFLNAVFAFAIAQSGKPDIRLAFALARRHFRPALGTRVVIGVALGISAIVVPRWGTWWFAFSLGIVIGVMMLTYVTVPSRLIGARATVSRRDKLTATVVGGAIGAVVCTPPYMLDRIGILLLGSHTFFALGVVLIVFGFTLQAGATGAVKAIKMSSKLMVGKAPADTVASV